MCSLVGCSPNARHEPLPEAEAQRKLEAVACTPWFGGVHLGSQYCPTAFTFLLLLPAVPIRPTAASIAVHRVASVASLRSSRHHFEECAAIRGGGLVLRACPIQNVRARSGRAVLIHERAGENIQMFVVLMVFNNGHLVAGVPLDQHRQLPRCLVLIEDLAP